LGQQITTAEGRQAAREVAIEILATLQAALGDLDKVKRIVKMTVLVNRAPGFTESHQVADGASELLREVFGEAGVHARTSHGGVEIPFGSCVEIEMIVEFRIQTASARYEEHHESACIQSRQSGSCWQTRQLH